MSIKQKTVHGLFWNFIDNFTRLGIGFVVGIILARLLTPQEFGLIGMTTIFIAISQSLIDSGFSQALIRKKDCTQADYSTVFSFNLFLGLLLYIILFLSAGVISNFFKEPQLKQIIQVVGIILVINALTIIQGVRLTKRLDFKLQTRISVISAVVSGIIGISMAYSGFGVWSLVYRSVSAAVIGSGLLWYWNKWKPSWLFDKKSFKEMFAFGSRLLLSGLIDTTYNNIYYLIIGKYFSATELGYYTRAERFQNLPSQNITRVIQRVSYPALASIKDDDVRLKAGYKKLIRSTMLITFVLMMGMAAIAKPMILVLVGEKWLPSVIYLQLLCFVGMFYPLHALNLNVLNVKGRSDLFLKLEIIKKSMAIPVIVVGIFYGIKIMILGMIIVGLIAYYLNSYWSGRFINYPIMEQAKDILPSFLLALISGITVYLTGLWMNTTPSVTLAIQLITGALLTFGIAELAAMENYLYLKAIVIEKLFKRS